MSGATENSNSRDQHLFGPGPKRILSLDGGGVRGIVALAFLERIEQQLRDRDGGRENFRLCDYFDLIGGTSTGAIIATSLALGFPVAKLIDLYLSLAQRAFQGSRWHGGIFVPKFRTKPLFEEIRRQVGEETLGSDALRTGLAVFAKRMDTGSPWVFHNNPRSRYFNAPEDDPGALANRDMGLAEILRASTAAPTYFAPETIAVAHEVTGLFVDGGVSPYNNPALQLLVMATSNAYGYGWPTGQGELSMISIGTGRVDIKHTPAEYSRMPSALQAIEALQSIIADTSSQAQAILQWLGHSPSPWTIDGEAENLADEKPTNGAMLYYQRFDIRLEKNWIRETLGYKLTDSEIKRLGEMDRSETVPILLELARCAAEKEVDIGKLITSEAG